MKTESINGYELDRYTAISTVELLETISALTENNLGEINTINATPRKDGIHVTAEFKTGCSERKTQIIGLKSSKSNVTIMNESEIVYIIDSEEIAYARLPH